MAWRATVQEARGRSPTRHRPRPARVLLVEDEEVLAEVYAQALTEQGHRVRVARDGLQAWNALRLQPPDLVVLDLGLPVLPGAEILRRLRMETEVPGPRVLVVSGAGPEDLSADLGAAAPDAWLRKPCKPTELQRAVAELLA